jgi:pimeloyl-ACP methyl ester carboxylesterase
VVASNPAVEVGHFTSEASRAAFLQAYDAAFTLWPIPFHEVDVETPFGTTHLHVAGSAEGVPIILLPGSGSNASQWFPNVATLGEHHPIFAVDTLGDPGRSIQRAPIHQPEDCAAWLDSVLAGLGFGRVHLVGHSYGGWIALNQALHAPARIASISLLDPGGLEKVGARFLFSILINALAGLAPRRLRGPLAQWLHNPVLVIPELLRMIFAGARGFRVRRPAPLPLTDDELRSIRIPTLAILGECSALNHSSLVKARLSSLMRGVQVEIIPDTGHGPSLEHPQYCDERILRFINAIDLNLGLQFS